MNGLTMPDSSMNPRKAFVLGFVLPAMVLGVNVARVYEYTVDDAFISYRYARNFAHGLGLVYNPGEYVEGYTNFLWTVLLAGGIKVGIDSEMLSKAMGVLSAFGSLALIYTISRRLMPFGVLPCIATWLFATSVVSTGWPVFGLETGLFVCLVLAGTHLIMGESFGETRVSDAFPWSGIVFGLAGLTRPEAPMFMAVWMLLLGRACFGKQNLLRGVLFAAPWFVHLVFRRVYYGAWVPNTFFAKTGDPFAQVSRGLDYAHGYFTHAGPVVFLAFMGIGLAVAQRRRDLLALVSIAFVVLVYVVLVGGDWMKCFRFMTPFEPFCFLLVDVGIRHVLERRDLATNLAVLLFALFVTSQRVISLRRAQTEILTVEKRHWDAVTLGIEDWLLENGQPGTIALGDIGHIGWVTNRPTLDLFGLVDPVFGKLPGGHLEKTGKVFLDRVFDQSPAYIILFSTLDCQRSVVPTAKALLEDRRLLERYRVAERIPVDESRAFCIHEQKKRP